jgi:hypothetical protein
VDHVIGQVRMARIAARVDDGDGDAAPGEARGTSGGAAHRVGGGGVEELDRVIGVDVDRPTERDRRLYGGHRPIDEGEREVVHALHAQAEGGEPARIDGGGHGVEDDDPPDHGGRVVRGQQLAEPCRELDGGS